MKEKNNLFTKYASVAHRIFCVLSVYANFFMKRQ